jgi:hypothetical protein
MTSVVSGTVTRHGKLLPVAVAVQPTAIPTSPWQLTKLAPVIVATAALSTVTLNDDRAQVAPKPNGETENPKLLESSLPSEVKTGNQLAADATDGTTNAHTANTTPKRDMLFFSISRHSS